MYEEGDIADGPNGALVFRGGQWVPMGAVPAGPQPLTIGRPDPAAAYKGQEAALNVQLKQQQIDKAGRTDAPSGYRFTAAGALEAIPGGPADPRRQGAAGSPEVTAKTRADALAGYKSAQQLEGIIADLEAKYAAGPGATSGPAGIADYLPYTENKQFDAAGNAARGIVGQALGFTGGQLNTATEAAMAVGPFLPQSGDRDAVILDKIQRLKDLRENARQRAIAQLGGVPDDNGYVTPVAPGAAPAPADDRRREPGFVLPPVQGGASPPTSPLGGGPRPDETSQYYGGSGGGGGLALNDDGYTTVPDPTRKGAIATLDKMLRSGVPDARIMQFATNLDASPASVAAALEFRRKNPTYKGGYNLDALGFKKVPVGLIRQGANAAAQSPVGAFGMAAGNAVTGNNLDSIVGLMGGNADLARAGMTGVANANPISSTAGNIAGGALAAAGLETGLGNAATRFGVTRLGPSGIARGADALYGGISGAGAADNGDRLSGGGFGAVAGLGGGMFGRGVARTGQGALAGVRNEAVQMLRERGVPMTFGQVVGQTGRLGGMIKGVEDRLTGLPVIGDVINARRREGVEGFNRAAFNEGLAPIGQQAVDNVGEQGIDNARQLISQSYDDTLGGVRFPIDGQFKADLGGAQALGARIPTMGDHFNYTLAEKVTPNIDPITEEVTGKGFQAIKQALRGDAAQFRGQPRGSDIADAFGLVEGAFDRAAERSLPGIAGDLRASNAAYRNLNILGDAVERGSKTDGLFTPAQLGMAAKTNARKYTGKLSAASTDRPFFDLQRAGQQVLPSQVPDSGTSGRLATALTIGGVGAAGAGSGYAAGDSTTGAGTSIATLVALAAGGSRPAQQALNALMLNRPDSMVRAGQALGRRAPVAGMFGAGTGVALLPQQ